MAAISSGSLTTVFGPRLPSVGAAPRSGAVASTLESAIGQQIIVSR
jgi:hypothetical protein